MDLEYIVLESQQTKFYNALLYLKIKQNQCQKINNAAVLEVLYHYVSLHRMGIKIKSANKNNQFKYSLWERFNVTVSKESNHNLNDTVLSNGNLSIYNMLIRTYATPSYKMLQAINSCKLKNLI